MMNGLKVDTRMQALYNFENNGKDDTGNGYNLSYGHGTPFGNGVYKKGFTTSMNYGGFSSFGRPQDSTSFALSAVVKLDAYTNPGINIFSNWYSRRTGRFPFWIYYYYGIIISVGYGYLYVQTGGGGSHSPTYTSNYYPLLANRKTVVFFRYNGTYGTMEFFVNGTKIGEVTMTGWSYYIGSGTPYFGNNEAVDNIAWWNTPPTAQQIKLLSLQLLNA